MLTLREIKDLLRQKQISISKRRGQNFLVDKWTLRRIIGAIDIDSGDEILEIGPGLGALTEDLAKQASEVVAVEKDKALTRVLLEKLSKYSNLKIICGDILQFDLTKASKKRIKVVSNLPYYITTPIISYLLEQQRQRIKDIYITVQLEVGRRLTAEVGNKDYSAFTVCVRYFTRPQFLFTISKKAFYPQPKVDSVFVHLHLLNKPAVWVNNQAQFFKVVRTCFSQRRKTILNSLTHKLKNETKNTIQQALVAEGIDAGARPEELSLEEFAKIENSLYKRRMRIE